jgi:hypothetical protein
MKGGEQMKNNKKTYESPKVTTHGTVEELTQSGGGTHADAIIGIGVSIGPSNVGTTL